MADKELCKCEWDIRCCNPQKQQLQLSSAMRIWQERDQYPGLRWACAMIEADSTNVCTLWVDVLGSGHNGSEDAMHPFVIVVKEENGHPAYPQRTSMLAV